VKTLFGVVRSAKHFCFVSLQVMRSSLPTRCFSVMKTGTVFPLHCRRHWFCQ
jgi:hypothetical protein